MQKPFDIQFQESFCIQFQNYVLNQLDSMVCVFHLIYEQNAEKISFGTGISQPVFDAHDIDSNDDWKMVEVPVLLGRYDDPYTEDWHGEDGLYACYNLDKSVGGFERNTSSLLEKIANASPGYQNVDAVWACGNAGRRRYHFTGTAPNFNVLGNSEIGLNITPEDATYFRNVFDNVRRNLDPNIMYRDNGYNLPVCNSKPPTNTITIDEEFIDVPFKYFAHVGVITFSNFYPDTARSIFVNDQRSAIA